MRFVTLDEKTLSEHEGTQAAREEARLQPRLILSLERERPLGPRLSGTLSHACRVLIGRGVETEMTLEEGTAELTVTVDDGWLSKRHARIERDGGAFTIHDEGSRNGTFVNGVRIERTRLEDGDLVEVGRTLLLFSHRMGYAATMPVRRVDPAKITLDEAALLSLSPAMEPLLGDVRRIAPLPPPVLLGGPTGSGKERVAQAIHRLSGRRGPFVAVNCGAIREELVESELFGSRRGAFTGAVDRPGYVQQAHGGTLLLDEIGDIPPRAQVALLRALEEREAVPVGATRPEKVDFRLVSATHRDLTALVAAERFRADLLARIAGFQTALPPLASRREDLGWLAGVLLAETAAGARATFTRDAVRALFAHDWPRNIRELRQCLTTAVGLAGGEPVDLRHLPEAVRRGPRRTLPEEQETDPPAPRDPRISDDEKQARLIAALAEHRGNISHVADALRTTRMQIHRWMKKFGLDPGAYRE